MRVPSEEATIYQALIGFFAPLPPSRPLSPGAEVAQVRKTAASIRLKKEQIKLQNRAKKSRNYPLLPKAARERVGRLL